MTGYSDRINHAFAFAAKHHDRQVRKGTRLPYLTAPANVAVILTRYGQDDDTVIAGILHDVVDDCVREHWTLTEMQERIGEKFGETIIDTILEITARKYDDEGNELDKDERRADHLSRIGTASERARWVCAADKVHTANAILADLRRTVDPDSVWNRFALGRDGTVRWYRAVYERLHAVGFTAPILDELRAVVDALDAARAVAR
jgi:(p)ppGpp synthase/HD superfamily hydrolase